MSDCCIQEGSGSLPNTTERGAYPAEDLPFENKTLILSPVLVRCLIGVSSTIVLLMMPLSAVVFAGTLKSEDFSWEPRFLILRNQLLCDMLFVLVTIPPSLYNLVHREVVRYGVTCFLLTFTMISTVTCSFMNLAFMAFERYYYICHSIHYISRFTRRRTKVGLCTMWVLALTMVSMYVGLLTRGQPTDEELGGFFCEADRLEKNLGFPREAIRYRKVSMSLLFFSCLLVFVYSYCRMYKVAKDTVQPFQQSNQQARKTVFIYGLMYALNALPIFFKISMDTFLSLGWIDIEVFALGAMLNQTVVMMISPCLHPIVYGLRNREVRLALKSMLTFRRSPNKRFGELPQWSMQIITQ
ncbi:olfactory receptor 1571-like [Ambystoma mexicanum]|uniref:olfactory receptor 1571-like n=1 Tax=Ambystoma mexicanum TaxID=8296 RepID=UPI0037E9B0AB